MDQGDNLVSTKAPKDPVMLAAFERYTQSMGKDSPCRGTSWWRELLACFEYGWNKNIPLSGPTAHAKIPNAKTTSGEYI